MKRWTDFPACSRRALAYVLLVSTSVAHAGGAEVFAARCAVCHQAAAQGAPGFVPPLTDTLGNYVAFREGRAFLAQIVTYGMSGPITVEEQAYNGSMAVYQPLSDQEAADALNYVLTHFNSASLPKDFAPFSAVEIQQHRAQRLSPVDVYVARQALTDKLRAAGKGR